MKSIRNLNNRLQQKLTPFSLSAENNQIGRLEADRRIYGEPTNLFFKTCRTMPRLIALLFVLFLGSLNNAAAQVSTLSAWTNQYHGLADLSGAFTVPTGTNTYRVLIVGVASSQTATGTARTATITYGGQTLSLAGGDMTSTTTRQHTALYYLNEAGIDAATSTTLAVSFGGGTTGLNDVFTSVYDYVEQATPIGNTRNFNNNITAGSTFAFGTGLTVNENEQAVEIISSLLASATVARVYTAATNWTKVNEQSGVTSITDAVSNAVFSRSINTSATLVTDKSSTVLNGAALGSMTGISLNALPKQFRSFTSGNLNSNATWQQSGDKGTTWLSATTTPTSSSGLVTIQNGHTVTLTAQIIVTDLSIETGGTLNTGASNFILGVSGVTAVSGTLTLSGTGTKTFSGNVTINTGGVWDETGAGDCSFSGDFINNGSTFTANIGIHKFLGASKTLSGGTATSIPSVAINGTYTNNSTLTVDTLLSGTGTLTNSSILNIGGAVSTTNLTNAGTMTVTGSGNILTAFAKFINTGTLHLGGTGTITGITNNAGGLVNLSSSGTIGNFNNATATSTLDISGLNVPQITAFGAGSAGNTVKFSGAGPQSAKGVTYQNLILSGSGEKIFLNTPTVNLLLSIEGTATVTVTNGLITYGANAALQYNKAAAYTATAEEWIVPFAAKGGVIIANTGAITMGAAKTFSLGAPLVINTGATLTPDANSLELEGDFINNGTFTSGSGAVTMAGMATTQSIGGFTTTGTVSMTKTAGTATFTGNVTAAELTMNGTGGTLNLGSGLTHTITTTLTRTNGTLNGGSSNLKLGGTVSGTGGTFTAATGTVEWNAAGAQTLPAVAFNNLILSGSGAKQLAAGTSVTGTLSIAPTGTAVASIGAGQNLSVGRLNLGGLGVIGGTWGSTTATTATNLTNTYFGATTGYLTVTTDSRTTPVVTPVVGTYTYSGSSQGPATATNTGTGTNYTFSYVGTEGTSYSASATQPTNVGSYTVTVTVAADANYNSASSSATAFTITKATPTASLAVSNSPATYSGSAQSATVDVSTSSVNGIVSAISTGGSATQTDAGTYAVTANFVPTDTANYNTLTGLSAGSFVIGDITTYTTSWDFGTPTASLNAVIAGDYTSGSFIAKNLTVNAGKTVTVATGTSITIVEALVNNGTITVENNANLIQTAATNTNSGSGTAIVKRDSNSLKRLDYTMWSSPVTGTQTLLEFSALTSAASPVRFYTYNPATNVYSAATVTSPFATGTGYLIRMPNEKPGSLGVTTDYYKGLEAIPYNGVFTGSINNGPITLTTLADKYYSVGNPYPSTLSADAFLSGNATNGVLYFWRRTNGAGGSAYSTYTAALGGAAGASGIAPNGTIQVGQGFIVKTGTATTSLSFTNAMRETAPTSTQFLKTKKVADKSRLWLDLLDATGRMNQVLIGYLDGATLGFDAGIDGKYFNDSKIALTSIVEGEEYVIQGRPTFDASDVVALGFKTDVAGDYTIALNSFDGVFESGQDVYLIDAVAGKEIDLKTGSYNFTAAAGLDNTRFSLKYQKTLKVDAPVFNENSIKVYKNNGAIVVNSTAKAIKTITIYDVQGRLLAQQKNVNATTATISNLKAVRQVLIVKISADDSSVISKKVLY